MARIEYLLNVALLISFAVNDAEMLPETKENHKRRTKRGLPALAVTVGLSLLNKQITDLMDGSESVRVGVRVDNYSTFTLDFLKCTIEDGVLNISPTSVHAGYREGFAGHKKIGTEGVWLMCSYSMAYAKGLTDKFHMMVDVEYNFGFHRNNRLSIAACDGADSTCNSLSLSQMSRKNFNFMKRRTYVESSVNIMQCNERICVIGTMGTGYSSVVDLDFYPQNPQYLANHIKEKMRENGMSAEAYKQFLKTTNQHAKTNNAMPLKCSFFAWNIMLAFLLFSCLYIF